MFIPPFMSTFLMLKNDEEGDNGGGESTEDYDDGLGVPYVEPEVENQDNTDVGGNSDDEDRINPAWQKVLDVLPAEFHKQVTPEFRSWDKNFAEVQSKFAPYKPLVDNNVSYEQVENSIKLAQAIAADPHAIYTELGRRFGFGQEQGQQQVDPEDNADEENQDDLMVQDDPRIAQLTQTVQQMQEMLQGEHQRKQETQVRETAQREIDSEWQALESKVGNISPEAKKDIIQRSVILGDATGNYSIQAGYQEYAAFVNRVRNSRANHNAPAVLSGNGGQPVTKKNLGQMDEEERINHIAAMAKSLTEGGS